MDGWVVFLRGGFNRRVIDLQIEQLLCRGLRLFALKTREHFVFKEPELIRKRLQRLVLLI